MDSSVDHLIRNLTESIELKQQLLSQPQALDAFRKAVAVIVKAYESGGRLYIAGNGGSASDAQHLAGELVCKLSRPRGPIAAEALAADVATLTAIGNDFGFEEIFARQLACKATPQDVFLALTTSGRSANILRALEECERSSITSVVFTGRDGGRAKTLADICLVVPGNDSARIQEIHVVLYHTLVENVEQAIFSSKNAPISCASAS